MSDADRYVEVLHAYVSEQFLEGRDAGLEPDSPLLELGILDSFSIAELVTFINERFGIRVPETEVHPDNLKSLRALAELVERLSDEQGRAQP